MTTAVHVDGEARCETCHGSGAAPGTSPVTCSRCGGRGVLDENQGLFSLNRICPQCNGRGTTVDKPCPTCRGTGITKRGREVKVRIPPGVDDGQTIRVKGRGEAGRNNGPSGDLYVEVSVDRHPLFGRRGRNLTLEVPITFPEAALGATVKVPTLDEPVTPANPTGHPERQDIQSERARRARRQACGGRRSSRDGRRGSARQVDRRTACSGRATRTRARRRAACIPRGGRGQMNSFKPGPDPMGRAVYVISVAAELAGVHPQTLRVYERRGLVDPLRTGGGSRRYSERDLERLRRIQDLTAEGLNLEGVRKVLVLEAEVERLQSELDKVTAEGREAVERTHRQYRRDLVPLRQLPVPGFRSARSSSSGGTASSRRK